MHRSFLTILLFVLAVLAANPAMSGSPAPPSATPANCKAEWGNSPASQTCRLLNHWVENNQCNFYASCEYRISTGSDSKRTTINNVGVGSVSGLSNCSGNLTKGSC